MKKFLDNRGGGLGSIKIFRRKLFVLQCQKISLGNPSVLRFRNFPVAKKFMDQRGGGEYQPFPSKIFCLTVPEGFIGGGGGVPRFSVESFLYHCRKSPKGSHLVFH